MVTHLGFIYRCESSNLMVQHNKQDMKDKVNHRHFMGHFITFIALLLLVFVNKT